MIKTINYDSRELPEGHRFAFWREEVERRFLPFELSLPNGEPREFNCAFSLVSNIGGVHITKFSSSSLTAARTKRHLADGNENFQLRLMQLGSMSLEMKSSLGGRTIYSGMLPTLSATLVSNGRLNTGYHIAPDNAPGRLTVLSIPRTPLLLRNPQAELKQLHGFHKNPQLIAFLLRYTNDILSGNLPLTAESTETIRDQLIELASMIIDSEGDVAARPAPGTSNTSRAYAVTAFIEDNFSKPEISITEIANLLGVTPRAIQMALEATGTTFGQLLMRRRLAHAKHLLSTSNGARLRISDVCTQCGFSDTSHFNRMFRREYGMSPTEFKRSVCE